jgi:hypothetical protein
MKLKLQTALTKLESELPPGAIRRAAVADCIAQALDLKTEREALRVSMGKLKAAQAALAIPPRPKPRAATKAVKPAPAPTASRRDLRQAPLPLSSYSFGHLAAEAEAGSAEALTELTRRGFARTARNCFTRSA